MGLHSNRIEFQSEDVLTRKRVQRRGHVGSNMAGTF